MSFFTSDQLALLSSSTVRLATLVDFEFDSGTQRVWNGAGKLIAAGQQYDGLAMGGGLAGIEGLVYSPTPESKQITLTMSGIKESLLALAIADTDQVEGRICIISFQLFDDEWQTIGDPMSPIFGVMQKPKVTRTPMDRESGGQQIIQLPVENLFFGRARPAAGRFTDRDQNLRFPGDRFFAYVGSLLSKVITFPDF